MLVLSAVVLPNTYVCSHRVVHKIDVVVYLILKDSKIDVSLLHGKNQTTAIAMQCSDDHCWYAFTMNIADTQVAT